MGLLPPSATCATAVAIACASIALVAVASTVQAQARAEAEPFAPSSSDNAKRLDAQTDAAEKACVEEIKTIKGLLAEQLKIIDDKQSDMQQRLEAHAKKSTAEIPVEPFHPSSECDCDCDCDGAEQSSSPDAAALKRREERLSVACDATSTFVDFNAKVGRIVNNMNKDLSGIKKNVERSKKADKSQADAAGAINKSIQ